MMLEASDNAILEKRQEGDALDSREQEERRSANESEEGIRAVEEVKKACDENEEADRKIASFLYRKGLSERLVRTLIGTDLTDEYVRLLRALDFDDDDIGNLRDLWRTRIEVSKSVDSRDEYMSQDCLYLERALSKPLIGALHDTVAKKPADPVEYLGHRLLHFRVCEERAVRQREEELDLLVEREKLRMQQKAKSEESLPIERKEEERPGEDWDYLDYGE